MNQFYQKDIISIKDYTKEQLETIFTSTDKIMQLNPSDRREICKGKTLGYLFYEPSTRTRLSFDSAMASIGGNSLGISDISSSSTQKGESLADTVKIMSIYSDVLVFRNPLDGSSRFGAEISAKSSRLTYSTSIFISSPRSINKDLDKSDRKTSSASFLLSVFSGSN